MTTTYRVQYVRCGKPSCRSCPHGPYWYAFWKEGGKTRSAYVGKPVQGEELDSPTPILHDRRHWLKMLCSETASLDLACEILEVDEFTAHELVQRSYKRLVKIYHPDCGGSSWLFSCLTAAWSFLKVSQKWK